MAKSFIRYIAVFAVCCLLCGCAELLSPPLETTPTIEQAYKENPTAFVVFSKSTPPYTIYVPIDVLMEYQSILPIYNGTWFRNQLKGEDLCIYNAYLYAMENYYIHFSMYVEDNDRDFYHIREALSLDSPFLAQNYDQSEWINDLPTNYRGEQISVSVEQFTESRHEKNMQALKKCEQIVAGIPTTCVTQQEKMEYLYRYVCEHVTYVDYDRVGKDDYLYDAVIKGETFCDGYSNMLNLLFKLIGVESYEAMGSDIEDPSKATPKELEDSGGHTWVVAKLDGEFYNFDPTYEDTDERDDENFYYFAFSDNLLEVKYSDLEEMRPKCTDTSKDFLYTDLVVDNIKNNSQIKQIGKLTDKLAKEKVYTSIVGVKTATTEKQLDKMLDKYFRYVSRIRYIEVYPYYTRNGAVLHITVKKR